MGKIMWGNQQNFMKTNKPVKKLSKIAQVNQFMKRIDRFFEEGVDSIEKIAGLPAILIPEIADWGCIHVITPDGTFERIAFVPPEILNNQEVYDWVLNVLPNDEIDGLPAVLQRGESKIVRQVNPVRRGSIAGIKSYILVPLVSHQLLLGIMTLIYSNSDRHYDVPTLEQAESVAYFISTSLEKLLTHNESQRINEELAQKVGLGSSELAETSAQLKQTEEMVQALFRVSKKLNATLDVEQILETLAKEAIQMVNGESGFAGLRVANGMLVRKYFEDDEAIEFEHTWMLGEGIPGWVLKFKVPYGTSDAENDPLLSRDLPINANVHSIICTPILDASGEVIAFFDIRNKKGDEGFTIADQEALLMLAPVASIAIQNALAYQQRLVTVDELREKSKQFQDLAMSLETAREEERIEVARELHDELGQSLTTLKFDLAKLSDRLEEKDESMAQLARDITTRINGLIKLVRQIATELRPGMLDDLGLAASIEWQVRDFEKRVGIECKLKIPEEELSLSRDQALAIFRILQEALTNVGRYSKANQVEVRLEKKGGYLILEIHDDGQGIEVEELSHKLSLGLVGMRERARFLGGIFEIHGQPGMGTTLMVKIPFEKSEDKSTEIFDASNITG